MIGSRRYTAAACGIASSAVAALALVSLLLGHELAQQAAVGMRMPTALMLFASGLGIYGVAMRVHHVRVMATGALGGFLAMTVTLSTDGALGPPPYYSPTSVDVGYGLPSIATLAAFVLVLASLVARSDTGYRRTAASLRAISLSALAGYLLDMPRLYWYWPGVSTGMAALTALGLLVLSLGISDLAERRYSPPGVPVRMLMWASAPTMLAVTMVQVAHASEGAAAASWEPKDSLQWLLLGAVNVAVGLGIGAKVAMWVLRHEFERLVPLPEIVGRHGVRLDRLDRVEAEFRSEFERFEADTRGVLRDHHERIHGHETRIAVLESRQRDK